MVAAEASLMDAPRARPAVGYSGLPGWVYVPAAAGALFVVLPLLAMALRLDWTRFLALVTSESSLAALRAQPADRRDVHRALPAAGRPDGDGAGQGAIPGGST